MKYPFVTVGIITKNEGEHIKCTIESILGSDYTKNRYEILVVDGNSTDNTQDIIKNLKKSNKNVRLIVEPWEKGSHGKARNLLIDNAKGELIAFTDGDCVVKENWLSSLVITLKDERKRNPRVVAAGGIRYPIKTKEWRENLLNNILGTYFGSGGSQGFVRTKKKYVDSIPNYNSIYVKDILTHVRYSEMGVGEDYEINLRLNNLGYKIAFTSRAVIYHHQENSLSKFLKQVYKYGKAQPEIYKKIKRIRFFAIISPIFVMGLIVGFLVSFISSIFFIMYIIGIGIYLFVDFIYTLMILVRTKKIYSLLSFIIYPLMHIFYGLGVIRGVTE